MEATNGQIIQVMGPVVDVEFQPGQLPEIMTALTVTNPYSQSAPADRRQPCS